MDPAVVSKFLHILSVLAFVTGLVAREIVNTQAARAKDIATTEALLQVSGRFERMVIGGSIAVLVFGLTTAWLQSLPILGSLQGGAVNWVLVSLALFILMQVSLVPTIFIPSGRVFGAAWEAAKTLGRRTPELHAAFENPNVRAGHMAELITTFVLIAVMVFKPF